jgi:hypothetical protein
MKNKETTRQYKPIIILLRHLFVSLVGLSPLPTTTDTTSHGTLGERFRASFWEEKAES